MACARGRPYGDSPARSLYVILICVNNSYSFFLGSLLRHNIMYTFLHVQFIMHVLYNMFPW